jgi:N-formylglutamate amidohydrolase
VKDSDLVPLRATFKALSDTLQRGILKNPAKREAFKKNQSLKETLLDIHSMKSFTGSIHETSCPDFSFRDGYNLNINPGNFF